MKTIEEQRLALLEETVEYYRTHNRATVLKADGTSGVLCSYVATEGNEGCAIGRKISPELRAKLQEKNNTIDDDNTFLALPSELQELGRSFLTALQSLHDGGELWHKKLGENGNELSEKGNARYNQIKINYCS